MPLVKLPPCQSLSKTAMCCLSPPAWKYCSQARPRSIARVRFYANRYDSLCRVPWTATGRQPSLREHSVSVFDDVCWRPLAVVRSRVKRTLGKTAARTDVVGGHRSFEKLLRGGSSIRGSFEWPLTRLQRLRQARYRRALRRIPRARPARQHSTRYR